MNLIRQAVVLGILIILFLVCDGICQCSDSNPCPDSPCFIESCLPSGACYNEPIQFNDGLECEEDCQCKSNRCEYGKCVKKCTNDDECEDNDIYCTDDYCLRGYCRSDNICPDCATKDDCDDGNPCTDDRCESGTCTHEDVYKHKGGEACELSCDCETNLCNDGICAYACTNEDQCNDGDFCTQNLCTDGVCHNPPIERKEDGASCAFTGDCGCISGKCINNLCASIPPCPLLSDVMDIINKWANGNADIGTVIDYINKWSSCQQSSGVAPSNVEQQKAHLMAMLQTNETSNSLPQCDPGYHLENGQCIPDIPQCNPGYHLENGQCIPDVPQCDPGYHLENGQCIPDQGPSDPTCELAYVTSLINKWANGEAGLSDVIAAINHWASSECTVSSGSSPVAVEQQKAQLMAMLQNPPNQEISNQEQSSQWSSGNQDPFGQGQYNQGSFPY